MFPEHLLRTSEVFIYGLTTVSLYSRDAVAEKFHELLPDVLYVIHGYLRITFVSQQVLHQVNPSLDSTWLLHEVRLPGWIDDSNHQGLPAFRHKDLKSASVFVFIHVRNILLKKLN